MPLTPQAAAFLSDLEDQNTPPVETLPPVQGRRMFAALTRWFGEKVKLDSVSDIKLAGSISARIYHPIRMPRLSRKAPPAIVYFHGGGWVLGDLETHDALCRRLADQSKCAVIAIDYSLSPEARYPTALNECYEALCDIIQHADEFNLNANRVAVAGDSAGGNLAAAVALQSRDRSGPSIDLQVLIYPALKPDFSQRSYVEYSDGFGLSRDRMEWFWDQYLGDQRCDSYAAPGTAANLSGLPTTLMITAEYDVLRSEGEEFANRLLEANVPTTHKQYEGNLHGFMHFSGIFDDGENATHEVADFCRQHLHRIR